MKCLILIFTLCSTGTFIDGQGKTDAEPAQLKEDDGVVDFMMSFENENDNADESSNSWEISKMKIADENSIKYKSKAVDKEAMKLFMSEVAAGDTADLMTQNIHVAQSSEYRDLGRRSEPQALKNNVAENPDYLTPVKAPPELVLLVAKESRSLRAGKDNELNDFDRNKILRSGNYWDGVWKEDVIPKSALRSVPEEKQLALKNNVAENPDYLTPVKAPPELVLLVAKESKLLRAGKDNELNDFDRNKILRSGNYWDGVWKEDVIPKSALRSVPEEKQLGTIKAIINPGTEFYKVVSRMKKISPKLIYIINQK